jgi:CheY-like chemotaxis protein
MGFPEGALTKTPGDLSIPPEFLLLLSFFNPKISEAIPKLHKLFKGGEVKKIPAGSPLALEEKKLLPCSQVLGETTKQVFFFPQRSRLEGVRMAKILIFDEDPSIRNLLAEELAGEGNVALSVGQPEFVGEEIAAFSPDLAILDIFIRGKFRWDFLEEVRKQDPPLPVILYSGYYPGGDPHLDQVDGFILKSCILDELKQCISNVLRQPDLAASM